jgi:outer membrane biosynthesis protein TonB
MARARSDNRSPALVAAALGHVLIGVAAIISWPWLMKPAQFGKVVPVTIVTNGPPAEMAPAVKAPEPAPAMAPAPTPEAPPQPAPISSAPPTPPAKAATPKPSPPAKPSPAKSANVNPDDFLANLARNLQPNQEHASTQATSGRPGAATLRAERTAQEGAGQDEKMSGDERQGLIDKLSKLWNPNCHVEAAAGINIKVRFRLTSQGWLVGRPVLADGRKVEDISDPLEQASAVRALSAVSAGQPYTDVLNPQHYADWRDMVVNFNAKQACGKL